MSQAQAKPHQTNNKVAVGRPVSDRNITATSEPHPGTKIAVSLPSRGTTVHVTSRAQARVLEEAEKLLQTLRSRRGE